MFVIRLKGEKCKPYYSIDGWRASKVWATVFPTTTELDAVAFDEGLELNEYVIEEA